MVPPPPSPPSAAAILAEEVERLARYAVDLRASRKYRALIPLGVAALLDPTPLRVGLIGALAPALFALSHYDVGRVQREGFSVRLILDNARFMSIFHLVIFSVTGGLASPVLPVMLVFTFAISMLLGRGREVRSYLAFQVTAASVLLALTASGAHLALSPRWFQPVLTPLHAGAVATVLVALMFTASGVAHRVRDVFDRVLGRVAEARAEVLEAHRAQAEELTALSGAIAHELKNPLASVKGLASLLARDVPEGKPAERLGVLRGEVDRMQAILDEFLTFSRPLVPAVARPTELRPLCDDMAALHEGVLGTRGLRLEVRGTGLAHVDPRKTRQILLNLVQNALDASPPGGAVLLTTSGGADEVVVTVDDQGAGPDASLGERLFDAGVTTKGAGNGLGLTIARALARQQGGELTLQARPGGGARATLRLPAARAA